MPRQRQPWFRFYSETVHNRKVRSLSPALSWYWVLFLCECNVGHPRGRLPELDDLRYDLRLSEKQLMGIILKLEKARLLDRDGDWYKAHDWDGDSDNAWQYLSDANQTPGRVARSHGTPKERGRNVVGTPKERLDKDQEKETDQEKDQDQETEALGVVAGLYENEIGTLTLMAKQKIIDLVDTYPLDCIKGAFALAVAANVRKLNYVEGICSRHKAQGSCIDARERAGTTAQSNGVLEPVGLRFGSYEPPGFVLDP